jgi:hypothetical protein
VDLDDDPTPVAWPMLVSTWRTAVDAQRLQHTVNNATSSPIDSTTPIMQAS